MKMLFIHDNKFWHYQGRYYSYGHFSYELLWKRYLERFDEIIVGGRVIETNEAKDIEKLTISDGPGVTIIGLPNLMTVTGLRKGKEAGRRIAELLRMTDFPVFRLPSSLGNVACNVANKQGINYAVEVVGCSWDSLWNLGLLAGKILAPSAMLNEKKYVAAAPNVLYVSRHFLQNRYPNHHFNVGCPDSNVRVSDDNVLKKRLDKIDHMDGEGIRLGLIASLNVGYKGHDTAILALEQIVKTHPNVRLCFLGDGDPTKWSKLAKKQGVLDKVDFCGSLPGGDPVLHWLDDIDIFIMPSLQETLGRALIEAMSRGCPAIGGAGTAVPEQLPDDCIHERKNYKQLAEMVTYMIDHPDYMKLCAEENFVRAKKYSEEILEERRDYFWTRAIGLSGVTE